ncbi:hypothetical protein ACTXGK_12715 [Psychrobacter sp. T6-5]|uniref:hypothetical protein n=1 Tax=Psychrobacter sp. T6-5 TaxID=3457451 RepID=UPI003FD5548B
MMLSNCIRHDQSIEWQYGSNYENNDSNLSPYSTNSSQNNDNLSFLNTIQGLAKRIDSDFLFSDVTQDITHFLKAAALSVRKLELAYCKLNSNDCDINLFTIDDNKRYHGLTTNCSAAKPSRHSLAIFMSKICLTNYQRFTNDINTNISALQTSHKYSTDTIGANIYDGLSGPNKIPLVGNKPRRLNTVVNNLSPFFLGGNKLTKCSGAIRNG